MECCGCFQSKARVGQPRPKTKLHHPPQKSSPSDVHQGLGSKTMDQRHISHAIGDQQQIRNTHAKANAEVRFTNIEEIAEDPQRQWQFQKPSKMITRNSSNLITNNMNRETQLTLNSLQNNQFPSREGDQSQQQQFTLANLIKQRSSQSHIDQLFSLSQPNKSCGDRSVLYTEQPSQYATTSQNNSQLIYAAKTTKFKCHVCYKTFSKILIADFNLSLERDVSLTNIQELFNLQENHICQCPYCEKTTMMILESNMLVGSAEQMEQYDLVGNADNLHLMETEYDCHGVKKNEIKNLPNTLEAQASDLNLRCGNQISDLTAQIDPDNSISQTSNLETPREGQTIAHILQQKTVTLAPTIFRHKFQRLRHSKKYAQLIVVGEMQHQHKYRYNITTLMTGAETQGTTLAPEHAGQSQISPRNQGTYLNPYYQYNSTQPGDHQHKHTFSFADKATLPNHASTAVQNLPANQQQQQHQVYVPPEVNHKPHRSQCHQFNRDIMRELIEQKMRKNKTFLELKVLPNIENIPKVANKKDKVGVFDLFMPDQVILRQVRNGGGR